MSCFLLQPPPFFLSRWPVGWKWLELLCSQKRLYISHLLESAFLLSFSLISVNPDMGISWMTYEMLIYVLSHRRVGLRVLDVRICLARESCVDK
ncbi:hypothetical protein BO94DRAFT_15102 [Aspergillus sclerotioniger CBS 115572]|uniref:Uncharacterized protein n=1 Tax=Aspergillus sclerotioniger CBS 115572 TaxID=1450535 RepID=A0A317XE32_9EURO|nr:hypothetical protein BO94DRAFT_15102 [Aspergillus sclerotioniger CBS 115572]PWY96585.1 hypothetical protein BO94DRAFT_15102 [Aspergillus sclerotioniger CBS 115572]